MWSLCVEYSCGTVKACLQAKMIFVFENFIEPCSSIRHYITEWENYFNIYFIQCSLQVCFCLWLKHVFLPWWWHLNVNSSQIGGHKMSVTENGLFFGMYDLFLNLAWQFHFPNNTGMPQIICICMLLIAAPFLQNYPITAYYVLYFCQCQYLMKYNISNYCNIWPNQDMPCGPILGSPHFNL